MIEFHADDFGLFTRQSQRILNCSKNGVLNGVSIMPNSIYLPECMQMLYKNDKDMSVTIHLNLVEGKCLSEIKDVDLLVNKDGIFNISFGKLLLASLSPMREKYVSQIAKEFSKQIKTANNLCKQNKIRLDSHVHYHMIPVVFDAMMRVINKDKLSVDYIRIPREHIQDYICAKALSKVKIINIVKAIVLNILSWRNCCKHKKFLDKIDKKIFYGVLYSGDMNYDIVAKLLPVCEKRIKNGEYIEMLFHPGSVLESDDKEKLTSIYGLHFLTHRGREIESDALIKLKENSIYARLDINNS